MSQILEDKKRQEVDKLLERYKSLETDRRLVQDSLRRLSKELDVDIILETR